MRVDVSIYGVQGFSQLLRGWWLVGGDDPVGAWTADRLGIEKRPEGVLSQADAH